MNNIHKLISEVEDEKERASKEIKNFVSCGYDDYEMWHEGYIKALSFCIRKLTLLLNTENENGGKNDASNDGKPM